MCEHVDKDNVLMLEISQEGETRIYTCKLCNNTFNEKQVEDIVLKNEDVRLI